MRVDVKALRQQAWRPAKVYAALLTYAMALGCTITDDVIVTDERQAKLLAAWWMEHAT